MLRESIRRVRRNHAVEHATVAVLLEQGARPPLGGYSTSRGFLIFGVESEDAVSSAASEGLARLQAREASLAVSPFCGTNLAVGAMLAGLLAGAILRGRRRPLLLLPLAAVVSVGAALLGRPLGMEFQRRYTTLSDAGPVRIEGVRRLWPGRTSVWWVSTSQTNG